jgi:anthranilate synthase component 1
VHYFEPHTKPSTPLSDPIVGLPEATFMITDSLVIFDHLFQTVKLVSHVFLPPSVSSETLPDLYSQASEKLLQLKVKLDSDHIPLPPQPPIILGNTSKSNVGKTGYEGFVTRLKEHIVAGNIIQAVPSQRLSRPTDLHPFNVYRRLRMLNPSPYMFYLDCGDVQLVGASPETLCKVEKRKVYNHAIAGTVKRGKNDEG